MANIIGIDLGTSTTLLARLSDSGEPRIYPNKENKTLTHSAVWFEDETKVIVGTPAFQMYGVDDPEKIFIEYKRDIGKAEKTYTIFGKEWTPRDFSALVLRQIREHFESNNGPVDAVVITVPANFTNEARVDTIKAAKNAGFNLTEDSLVNEPTAAAIYYASTSKLKGKYLVYDFGGGTFDATILDVDGDDIRVLTSMGVQKLGGKDLDEKLINLIGKKYTEASGNKFNSLSELNMSRWDIQTHKEMLTARDSIDVVVRLDKIYRIKITRNEFNEAISTLIATAELAVDDALADAKINAKDLSGVFLAGGTTLVPAVAQSVERHLGIKPISRDPVGSVALGACIYAAIKNKNKLSGASAAAMSQKKVVTIAPHHYGTICRDIETGKRYVDIIIPKNATPLPYTKCESYWRLPEQLDSIPIRITESTNPETDPDFVTIVRTAKLKNLPPVEKNSEIKVTFTYDTNGCMRVNVLDVHSGIALDFNPFDEDKSDDDDETGDDESSNGPKKPKKPKSPIDIKSFTVS
jgi:molecular chaperone DnaK